MFPYLSAKRSGRVFSRRWLQSRPVVEKRNDLQVGIQLASDARDTDKAERERVKCLVGHFVQSLVFRRS